MAMTPTPTPPSATADAPLIDHAPPGRPRSRALQRAGEQGVVGLLYAAGVFTVVITVSLVLLLFGRAAGFFGVHGAGTDHEVRVTFWEFITGTEWNPLLGAEKHFGIWPLIWGTTMVAAIAMAVAIPFGLITAVFLSEYAPKKLRAVLKPVLEILAGVPTVVYGFFALTVITPSLQRLCLWLTDLLPGVTPDPIFGGYSAASAGIAAGIMCLPIVTSLSEDALRSVPRSLREAAYAVGGTRFEVSTKVVLPAALSGVVAAVLLAIARAAGETMIVALAAGGTAKFLARPTESAQTMTAYMVQIFKGDVSNFGAEYYSAYAVACTLFLMTLALTVIGSRVLARFREVYD
jgi:phosphate transport system permease protein